MRYLDIFRTSFVAVICVICFYYIANSMSIINRSAAINYRTYCKSTVFTVFCRDLLLYNPAYLLEKKTVNSYLSLIIWLHLATMWWLLLSYTGVPFILLNICRDNITIIFLSLCIFFFPFLTFYSLLNLIFYFISSIFFSYPIFSYHFL